MKSSLDKLWKIENVSEFLQVKTSVIKYWLRCREIPHIKIGREYRFDPDDIKRWIEEKKKLSDPFRKYIFVL